MPAKVTADDKDHLREPMGLLPLVPGGDSSPERRPGPGSGGVGSLLGRLQAGIDDLLEAEMVDVARAVTARRNVSPGEAPASTEFDPGAHQTREAPQPLLDAMLGANATRPADGVARAVPRLAGDLASDDFPALIGRFFIEGATGRLRLRQAEVEKLVFIEVGRPVLASSSASADRMIEMLARDGKLTPAQHQRAMRAAAETGRRMGALLVDLGIMKSGELLPAVRQHYEEIMFSLFAWQEGTWQFEPGVVADPKRIRLLRHPGALVAVGLGRGFPLGRMRARLGSDKNVFKLESRGPVSELLAEVTGGVVNGRLPVLFDGNRTVEDVARAGGVSAEVAIGTAYALLVFRLLAPSGVGGGAPHAGSRDLAIERARLESRVTLIQDADYFTILGIDRKADEGEIRRAYERQLRELTSELLGAQLAEELAAEVATLRSALHDAWRMLGDPRRRLMYGEALPPPSLLLGAPS